MEYFGKCQYQPQSMRNKYLICSNCYHFIERHSFISTEGMCQKCSILKSEDYICNILIKASKSPGIKYIIRKIMFEYL